MCGDAAWTKPEYTLLIVLPVSIWPLGSCAPSGEFAIAARSLLRGIIGRCSGTGLPDAGSNSSAKNASRNSRCICSSLPKTIGTDMKITSSPSSSITRCNAPCSWKYPASQRICAARSPDGIRDNFCTIACSGSRSTWRYTKPSLKGTRLACGTSWTNSSRARSISARVFFKSCCSCICALTFELSRAACRRRLERIVMHLRDVFYIESYREATCVVINVAWLAESDDVFDHCWAILTM